MTKSKTGIAIAVICAAGLLAAAPVMADDVGNDPSCIQLRNYAQFDAATVRSHARGLDPNDPLQESQTSDLDLGGVPCDVEPSVPELVCSGTVDPGGFEQLAAFTRDCTAPLSTRTSPSDDGHMLHIWYRSGAMLKMSSRGSAMTIKFVY